jgi:CRISPR-associated endonuclease/helicase Cas3
MEPLAHSARPDKDIPTQSYKDHVCGVVKHAADNVGGACIYLTGASFDFQQSVVNAAICHDLGKLDSENQHVLETNSQRGLPVKHEDAGAAFLLKQNCLPGAILASKHHQGLPNLYDEKNRERLFLQNEDTFCRTEKYLAEYVLTHNKYVHVQQLPSEVCKGSGGWGGLRFRLALSCLVDGDHGDTARHYGNEKSVEPPSCRWQERLESLECYTDNLFKQDPTKTRNILRRDIFLGCKNAKVDEGIIACDSPVGTGKTTAVMAHMLKAAIEKKLRHIIVVLPYTNIIKQSVDTYRKALVLSGENEFEVIAEHHHQADFDHIDSRHLTTLWKAPIIVTTAVQFFETIAANKPARLRKLHELPGSAIFIDEVHAAIPAWMWPQMWQWVKEFVTDWTCHFVLASGSLPRFWQFPKIAETPEIIPDLVPEQIRYVANSAEINRIKYLTVPESLDLTGLIGLIVSTKGPRLVIMNTVQSAAVVAKELFSIHQNDGEEVLHLSTALCPADRDKVVEQIVRWLKDKKRVSWTLVATSCVEAGMDFSFVTALRESCSTSSLIQIGGRANRHDDEFISEIKDFRVDVDEPLLNQHPSFRVSKMVLAELFGEGKMNKLSGAELATEAMRREIMTNYDRRAGVIKDKEKKLDYPEVAKLCRVIDSDTKIVVVSPAIIKALEQKEKIEHKDLLRHSVQLWLQKIDYLSLEEIYSSPGVYKMPEDYYGEFRQNDNKPCFGYMKGILPLVYAHRDGLII